MHSLEAFLDGILQPYRQGQSEKAVHIPDVLPEKRVEYGIAVARKIATEPPHPVASFRNQQLFVGQIPLAVRYAILLGHQRGSRPHNPLPRLMVFGMADPDGEVCVRP